MVFWYDDNNSKLDLQVSQFLGLFYFFFILTIYQTHFLN